MDIPQKSQAEKRPEASEAKGAVLFHDVVSDAFRKEVVSAYKNIPAIERDYLETNGLTIVAASKPGNHLRPGEKFVFGNSGDTRTRVHEVYAWYNDHCRAIILSEKYLDSDTNRWKSSIHTLKDTVAHEFGHAFDHIMGTRYSSHWMSDSPSFKEAYEADVAALTRGDRRERKRRSSYYIVKNGNYTYNRMARREVFTEQWARLNGSDDVPLEIFEHFPRVFQWMEEFIEGHKTARMQGPEAVQNFVKDFGDNRKLPKTPPSVQRSFTLSQAKALISDWENFTKQKQYINTDITR